MDNNMNEYQKRKARKKRNLKIFWGFLMVLGAVALIAYQLGLIQGALILPGFAVIILVAGLIKGIASRNFGLILFPIALLVIVLGSVVGVPVLNQISPWAVLIAALLLTLGFGLLFPGFEKGRWKKTYVFNHNDGSMKMDMKRENGVSGENVVDGETRNGDMVCYENRFGNAVKYLVGGVSMVDIKSDFGSFEIFFNDAVLINNKADVKVNSSFGEVKLHIPSAWKVVFDVNSSMGGVDEHGTCNPEGENELHIFGSVSFGQLEIDYV